MSNPTQTKEDEYPTADEQFFRIVGTTAGGSIGGAAIADWIVPSSAVTVAIGAVLGGLAGFGILVVASYRASERRSGR